MTDDQLQNGLRDDDKHALGIGNNITATDSEKWSSFWNVFWLGTECTIRIKYSQDSIYPKHSYSLPPKARSK